MTTLRPSRGEAEYPRLLEVWRSAVEASHHFLARAGRHCCARHWTASPKLTLDVNEQNPGAVGFYLHHGFEVAGRQEADSDGRPFPLLQLKRV